MEFQGKRGFAAPVSPRFSGSLSSLPCFNHHNLLQSESPSGVLTPAPIAFPLKNSFIMPALFCCIFTIRIYVTCEFLAGQSHKIHCPFLVAAVTGLPAGSEVPKGRAASERLQQAGGEAALQQPGAPGALPGRVGIYFGNCHLHPCRHMFTDAVEYDSPFETQFTEHVDTNCLAAGLHIDSFTARYRKFMGGYLLSICPSFPLNFEWFL